MISIALLSDLRIAEPGARISFAGGRVKGDRKEGTAEAQLSWGTIDEIVPRSGLRSRLIAALEGGGCSR